MQFVFEERERLFLEALARKEAQEIEEEERRRVEDEEEKAKQCQDELEAELKELEEQLLQPAATVPAAPVHVPAGKQPVRLIPSKRTAEEDELAALQAEMAL